MMTIPPSAPDELSDFAELIRDEQEYPGRNEPVDPKARRARIRRTLIILGVVVAVFLAAIGGYVVWALNAPLGAPAATVQTPVPWTPSSASVVLPSEGSSAISISGADEYLVEGASASWKTSGPDTPRAIASITKLITALVILDERPLESPEDPGPTIVFDKADHDLYDKYYVMGATIAPMPTGSSMSQRDALATMLIPSACNYAEAVSTWAFGSQGAFLSAARAWIAAHGLTGTTIVEPTGISDRNTSTPSDLLAIGKLAAANPVIADITSTRSLDLPGPGQMRNTNDLLGTSGVTGLKTGNLGAGMFNLLYTATLDVGSGTPLTAVGAVLGGYSHDSVNFAVTALLDSIRAGFHTVSVATRGQEVGTFTTPWGATARMVVGEDASIFTWSDTEITPKMQLTTPTTYQDGEVVGSITWTAGPNTVTAPVEMEGSIAPPGARWRLTHPFELGQR